MNSDGDIAAGQLTAVVSEPSTGQQYMWGMTGEYGEQLGRLFSLSLDGRLRRMTGVVGRGAVRGSGEVRHLAVNKHQLVVSRCTEVDDSVEEEGGEAEEEGGEKRMKKIWTIHRYRIVNE